MSKCLRILGPKGRLKPADHVLDRTTVQFILIENLYTEIYITYTYEVIYVLRSTSVLALQYFVDIL